jgi:hypothetical protein
MTQCISISFSFAFAFPFPFSFSLPFPSIRFLRRGFIKYTLPLERAALSAIYTLPLERLYQLYASFGEALSIIRFLWRGFINYTLPLERLYQLCVPIPIPIPFAIPIPIPFAIPIPIPVAIPTPIPFAIPIPFPFSFSFSAHCVPPPRFFFAWGLALFCSVFAWGITHSKGARTDAAPTPIGPRARP